MAEQPYTQTAGSRGYLTNTGTVPQPLPTTPMVGPRLPTPLTAPAPTPYGSFTPPDLSSDPSFQGDLALQQQGVQRSAAARGSLLTGGLLARLQTNASDVANRHLNDITARSLDAYRANRETNAQNFSQTLGGFGAQRDVYHDASDAATTAADVTNTNASGMDAYRRELEAYRAHLATMAGGVPPGSRPLPGDPGYFGTMAVGAR